MLLSTAYFPPVQFFSKIVDLNNFFLESKENYQRQSYRNRFIICAANGQLSLSVPVVKGHSPAQPVKEVKIDYSGSWQRIHLKSVESAYRHSPFFEYYIDDFIRFWKNPQPFLYDLNLNIIRTILSSLELDIKITETSEYIESQGYNSPDFRKIIHPKKPLKEDPEFQPKPYIQNFSDRFGFIPNLSIIDLLFQKGPESLNILRESRTGN